MKLTLPTKQIEAREVLYVRLKTANKEWLEEQAKEGGFKNLYDFIDALIESLRDSSTKKAG